VTATASTTPTLDSLPTTRRAILLTVKKRGEARAEELADALSITASAVRQHLTGLAADGLVAHRERKDGPGRPKHLWHLTAAAEGLFPRAYGELTNELLDYVSAEDPALVERLFARRRQRRIENANARLAGLSFDDKVAELARILDEDGYLADWVRQPDGSFDIVEHNCAILSVALRYGNACSSELEFLRAVVPEATIERTSHMVAGAHHCGYRVSPRPRRRRAPVSPAPISPAPISPARVSPS
jgi:DeoR family suf operon transcriptional repressor